MFRVFDIPVRIHPFFFVTAVVLGMDVSGGSGKDWMTWLFVWVALMFAGVLLHELGHAFAGRAFGLVPSIELYAFGGLTWWREGRALDPKRSIFVSLAGPFVGIAIGLAALAAARYAALPLEGLAGFTLRSVVWINLGWGVLNLVPMLPLDGGNVMASAVELFAKKNGRRAARYVSVVMAVGLAAWALAAKEIFMVALLGYLAWVNIRDLRAEKQMQAIVPYRDTLGRAYAALAHGDGAAVIAAAQVLTGAQQAQVQVEGQLLLVWGRLLSGDVFGARSAADKVPSAAAGDSALQGAFLLADGDDDGAARHFESLAKDPAEQARFAAAFMATGRYDVAVKLLRGDRPPAVADAPVIQRLAEAAERTGHAREADALRAMSLQSQ